MFYYKSSVFQPQTDGRYGYVYDLALKIKAQYINLPAVL